MRLQQRKLTMVQMIKVAQREEQCYKMTKFIESEKRNLENDLLFTHLSITIRFWPGYNSK